MAGSAAHNDRGGSGARAPPKECCCCRCCRCGSSTLSFTPVVRLAVIGLLVNTQPSEPFLTPYIEATRNVTHAQLVSTVYPFWTWSALLFILPCGLLAELLGYRRIIFVGLLARQVTRCCLLFTDGVLAMVAAQVAYGLATAVNTAVFYSYVYVVLRRPGFVPAEQYGETTRVYRAGTAWVRGAYSFGNLMGSLLGQSLVSLAGVSLGDLFYISWAFSSLGFLFAVVFMPPPPVMSIAPVPSSATLRGVMSSAEAFLEEQKQRDEHEASGAGAAIPDAALASAERTPEHSRAGQNLYHTLHTQGCLHLCRSLLNMFSQSRVIVVWSVWWWFAAGAAQLVSNYYTSSYVECVAHPQNINNTISPAWRTSRQHAHQEQQGSFENPFGILEGLNQAAYTLAVWLPVVYLRIGLGRRRWDGTQDRDSSHALLQEPHENGRGSPAPAALRSEGVVGTLVPMASLSTLAGGLLLSSTIWCRHAVLSYALLILYNGCFAFLISLAASSIAAANMAHVKRHEGDGPADAPKPSVLFGVNGFMSLLFASGLQVVASGMALTARHVMLMCGGVFCAVSLVCAVLLLAGRERR